VKALVIVAALVAVTLAACGGRTKPASTDSTATGKTAHNFSAPRYRACGRVDVGSDRLPTYAHNVSCAVAASVAKHCFTRSCFGQFALASPGAGALSFPEPPVYKPLGFECYQAVPPYAVGLPALEAPTGGEWRPFVCHRERLVLAQQLVGYFVLIGGGP
jgi:hypothetical protein